MPGARSGRREDACKPAMTAFKMNTSALAATSSMNLLKTVSPAGIVYPWLVRASSLRPRIERIVAAHESDSMPVSAAIPRFELTRLQGFFSTGFLERVRVSPVESVPLPGGRLWKLLGVGPKQPSGITFGTHYFVVRRHERDESLHFHELIHAVQWDELGFERFLALYIRETLRNGYAANPFEQMAYAFQRRFENDPAVYPAESQVRESIGSWIGRHEKGGDVRRTPR